LIDVTKGVNMFRKLNIPVEFLLTSFDRFLFFWKKKTKISI
jgi:hypothetical protein